MKTLQLLVLTTFLAFAAQRATGQITIYQDSARFDNDYARLRDIDFEDVYAVTVDRMTIRNPYGLHTMSMYDSLGEPTSDLMLWLSQGATINFPMRTRTVMLNGYSNPFYVRVTTFADSTYDLDFTEFPYTINDTEGIARIQFYGSDGIDLDINWGAGLYDVAALNEDGDTVAFSNFDELEADHYYFMGTGIYSGSFGDTSFMRPVDVHGITINEPHIGLVGAHLSYFEARPDSDNPIGNLGVLLFPDATIDFPRGTEGALLVLEKIHIDDTLLFEVTDYNDIRDTVMVVGAGREYDTAWVEEQRVTYAHVGFGSAAGIREVRLLDAWTMAPWDLVDTIIDGEPTQVVIYEPIMLETYVMAVHLAEIPPSEIGMISSDVETINDAGYLAQDQTGSLNEELQGAIVFAETGENAEAVGRLTEFSSKVDLLHAQGTLVKEEARKLRGDAAYVISRLQTGTSSVSGVERQQSILPSLSNIRTERSGVWVSYHLPQSVGGEVVISDMRGNIVRRIVLEGGSENGQLFWDARDANGMALGAGSYLLSLGSGGRTATAKVVLLMR